MSQTLYIKNNKKKNKLSINLNSILTFYLKKKILSFYVKNENEDKHTKKNIWKIRHLLLKFWVSHASVMIKLTHIYSILAESNEIYFLAIPFWVWAWNFCGSLNILKMDAWVFMFFFVCFRIYTKYLLDIILSYCLSSLKLYIFVLLQLNQLSILDCESYA